MAKECIYCGKQFASTISSCPYCDKGRKIKTGNGGQSFIFQQHEKQEMKNPVNSRIHAIYRDFGLEGDFSEIKSLSCFHCGKALPDEDARCMTCNKSLLDMKIQALAGNAEKQRNLAIHYKCTNRYLGYSMAAVWYIMAANSGEPKYLQMLIKFLLDKRSDETAVRWALKDENKDNPIADFVLAVSYRCGCGGLPQNFNKGVELYRNAATKGLAEAQRELALLHYVNHSYQESARLFRQAAEQGDACAQYNLGVQYMKGEGFEQDLLEACKWMKKAKEQDFNDAAEIYDNLRQYL